MKVTRQEALDFLNIATRNWSDLPPLEEDDIGDVATALLAFLAGRLPTVEKIADAIDDAAPGTLPSDTRHQVASKLLATIKSSDVEPRQPAQQNTACEDEQTKPGDAHHLDPQRIKTIAFCNHGGEVSSGFSCAASTACDHVFVSVPLDPGHPMGAAKGRCRHCGFEPSPSTLEGGTDA